MELKKYSYSDTVSTGVMGIKRDIPIPCVGKRIVNIDFKCKSKAVSYKITIAGTEIDLGALVGGRGNAYITDRELPDLMIHLWADLYTEVSYEITVEVEL